MSLVFGNLLSSQIFCIIIAFLSLLSCTQSGCKYGNVEENCYVLFFYDFLVNNLHSIDGTSTAEIIAGDVFFEIVDPVELEYTYRIRPAKDFGAPFVSKYCNNNYCLFKYNIAFQNESFQVKNIPLVPVIPQYACETPTNIEEVEGNVALVERG